MKNMNAKDLQRYFEIKALKDYKKELKASYIMNKGGK